MAGYTSRFFLTLTIPSVFGFLSVLWFLKRKGPSNRARKAIQVQNLSESEEEFEKQFLTLDPMKLKNDQEESSVSSEMQLKETTTQTSQCSSPNANGIQQNGKASSSNRSKKSKSKLREKNATFPQDYILGDGDRHSLLEDNGIELANGIDAIDLNTMTVSSAKDELLNTINKSRSDMEVTTNGTNSPQASSVLTNGDAEKHSLIISETDSSNRSTHQLNGGGSAKELCDKTADVDVPSTQERNFDESEKTDLSPNMQSDSPHEPLTLPVDCTETLGEMLESPGATYCDSVVDSVASARKSSQENVNAEYVDSKSVESESVSTISEPEYADLQVDIIAFENSTDEEIFVVKCEADQEDVDVDVESDDGTVVAICASVQSLSSQESEDNETVVGVCIRVTKVECAAPLVRKVTFGSGVNESKSSQGNLNVNSKKLYSECFKKENADLQVQKVDKSVCENSAAQENVNVVVIVDGEAVVIQKGSNDSGKGASEIQFESYQVRPLPMVYEFDIFQEYVGLLIGRNGRHVRYIKEETNANILIKRHPYYDRKKICAVTGTDDEIHAALKLIRKRFPIETYPTVTLSQIPVVPYDFQHPDLLKLCLPEGVSFDVMLSATVNAGHFFLQQPTHPTFHSLPFLSSQMTAAYSQDINAPPLHHVDKGYVCTANIADAWYRAEIDEVFEDSDECRVKFLDYGGYAVLPRTSLKQIRCDFMYVPFQATECYLGDVTIPDGATDWSREATAAFEELAQGQILQGFIVAYAENRVPFVKLFKVTGVNMIDINEELVRRGFAKSLHVSQQ